jgi:hypothetical protein
VEFYVHPPEFPGVPTSKAEPRDQSVTDKR